MKSNVLVSKMDKYFPKVIQHLNFLLFTKKKIQNFSNADGKKIPTFCPNLIQLFLTYKHHIHGRREDEGHPSSKNRRSTDTLLDRFSHQYLTLPVTVPYKLSNRGDKLELPGLSRIFPDLGQSCLSYFTPARTHMWQMGILRFFSFNFYCLWHDSCTRATEKNTEIISNVLYSAWRV